MLLIKKIFVQLKKQTIIMIETNVFYLMGGEMDYYADMRLSLKLTGVMLLLAPAMTAYADVNLTSQHQTQILVPAPPPPANDFYSSGTYTQIAALNSFHLYFPGVLVLPSNPQVVAGDVQISQNPVGNVLFSQNGNTMTITENSQKAVINWGSFNISQNAEVDFHQPNAQAIVLNRVENGSIEIDGKLTANGQVFLIDATGVLVLPSNPQVVAGDVQISQNPVGNVLFSQNGNTMTITENSQKAVINWGSFNISQNAEVDFHQPNAQAIVLNRVENGSIEIDGKLTANGQVFLIDANGVIFGSTAQVNVGGLVASSLNLSDSNFLNGNYQFQLSPNNRADVVNNGTITAADGGYVAFLSNQNAINNGTIQARLGVVELAAGDGATLVLDQGQLVSIQVDPATVNTLVANNQLIQANGGTVILTASAASSLNSAVVSNSGVIEANTLSNQNGQIELLATGDASQVNNSGTLDVSAPNGGNGGAITEQAGTVTDSGKLNASGDNGGQIMLAADKALNLTGNQTTADGNNGSGGVVDMSSQGTINLNGISISANGTNGDGGNIKLSAAGDVNENGGHNDSISANANNGNGGAITVAAIGNINENDVSALHATANGNSGGNIMLFANNANLNNQTLSANGLQGNGGNINVNAFQSANLNNNIITAGGSSDGGNINVSATQLSLASNTINANGDVNGGTISLPATNTLLTSNTITANGQSGAGGTISLNNSGDLYLDGNQITATGGTTAGNINAQSDTLEYWTTNVLNASVATAKPDVININANNQQYVLQTVDHKNILQFNNGETYNLQPGDNITLDNNISINHNDLIYYTVLNNPIMYNTVSSTTETASNNTLSVNAGVITTNVDKANLSNSNRLSNLNNEGSENQAADITIEGNGINDGLTAKP